MFCQKLSSNSYSVKRRYLSKIEKIPMGIQGQNSGKDMASSRNLVSTSAAQASPKTGAELGVRKGKRSLIACHNRCKCSMETNHNSVKVQLGIKVMKSLESLNIWISEYLNQSYYILGVLLIDYIESPRADTQSYQPAFISARGLL